MYDTDGDGYIHATGDESTRRLEDALQREGRAVAGSP